MKLSILLATLFVAAFAGDGEVLILTDSNFDEMIAKHPAMLVEFFAPWCGHCKKLAPEYAQAAGDLKGKEAVLASVDATVEKELGQRFKIEGYPTLKFFREGVPTDYDGGRTAKDLVSFMVKQTSPAVQPLLTAADVDEFIPEGDDSVVVVAYTAADSDVGTFFAKVASAQRMKYTFGLATDPAVATEKSQAVDTIVLYKSFDEKMAVYTGDLTSEAFVGFLGEHSLPLLGAIGPDNYAQYNERGIPIVWLFVDTEQPSEDAKTELQKIAGDFKGKVSMVHLSGPQYARWAGSMGLSGKTWPGMAQQSSDGPNFVWPEDQKIVADDVKTWLTGVADGTVKPTIKSEPIPDPSHDADNVRIVVADNFDEVVMDKTKDVLIEFYAPWCGHCKSLAPIWGEVATAYKEHPTAVIAKMDATANDAPPTMGVRGFPTLKLVTAVDNEVLDFNGAREKDAIMAFVEKNGKANKE